MPINNQRVKNMLPRGWTIKLMKSTGKSRTYISEVVNQEDVSSDIWAEVISLAEAHQKKIKSNKKKIQKLINQVQSI